MQPASSLTIHTKGILGQLIDPKANINGHTVNLRWGENVIPASPGVHHITVYSPWLWKVGKAEITIDNTNAPAPPVYYALPYTAFQKGAIGHEPQKNPGFGALMLVIALGVLLPVLCCVGLTLLDS